MKEIINYILNDLGAHVFLPMIMIIVGLIVRMKFKDAFSSALTLGVAFLGMGMVLGFMFNSIGPASESFVKNTGLQLNAIDTGWSPLASVAWGWPYAFFLFPIQIGINIIMLATKQTNTLNVDLWNVWNKILTAVFVTAISGSVIAGLAVGAVEVYFELKNSDLTQAEVYKITKIPGVACPHSMALFNVIVYPFDLLLRKIPFFNRQLDAEHLKDKIGIFAENHVMGFIVGILIGIFARYDVSQILTLGVQAATALRIFPMVAKLFMEALAPISDAASEFMKKRFPGREFYIGLDWPFLAGSSELWVTTIILVPITILFAVILPGNNVLPFGGIINICIAVPLLIVTGGNLLRMIVIGIITTPVFLYVGTYFAPTITELARKVGTVEIPANSMITWSSMEAPVFRFVWSYASGVMKGNFTGVIFLAIWLALWVFYVKGMKKRREEELKAEMAEA